MTGQLFLLVMTQIAKSQRWQRRKEERPAELLDAALSEFFEKGFAAARLEDIAARAGVSKGTVYLYFDSKEDMFEALVHAIPQANIEQVRAIAGDPSVPADKLLERVLTFVGGFLRDERMIKFPRLIISDGGRFPKLAETYKREVISRGVGILSSIIERGIAEGRFRKVDPERAAFAAISPLLFVAIWHTTFERFDDKAFDADAYVAQHIETFLRGIGREAEA
jgi:AcrR family transcriptional regulator